MKKLIALATSALLAACGGAGSPDSSTSSSSSAQTERVAAADPAASAGSTTTVDPLARVNAYIGTGIGFPNPQDRPPDALSGSTYPGAALPFGMVQFSPDTGYGEANANGGYNYAKPVIQGFSLIHASGTGCPAQQDISILPFAGPISASPATSLTRFQMPLAHASEQISPGFYGVTTSNRLGVELTVSRRGGFGRFSFPDGAVPNVIFNVGRNAFTGSSAQLQVVGNDTVEGAVQGPGVCGRGLYTVYFHGRFDRPFSSFGTYRGSTPGFGSRTVALAPQTGGWVTFADSAPVQLRIAVSYVSVDNARLNLQAELAGVDFDSVRQQARNTWGEMLGRIQVDSNGRPDDEVKFYTALYHALLHPTLFSDVNNQYVGFDNVVRTTSGWDKYATFSGWDTSRSQMQLVAWLAPKQGSDMAQSLVVDALASNAGFPRWPTANSDSCMMYGDPGAVIVSSLHAFGSTDFDTASALAVMERGANTPSLRSRTCETRPGLSQYLSLGYIPFGPDGAAANTLEYGLADAAIGQFAGALGDSTRRNYYLARGQSWKLLLGSSGYMQPRNASGSFVSGLNPGSANDGAFGLGFGNAAQYTFMVPQNYRGLIDRMGGNSVAVARLDAHFQRLNIGSTGLQASMSMANEQGTPWAYAFAAAPWKSQAVVRRILDEQYANRPDGLMGTDDLGSLSAWYVWAALGLYPEIPGVGGFVLGSPLFPRTVVRMGNGRSLTINAANAGALGTYVDGMAIDSQPSTSTWLPLTRLTQDTVVDTVLAPTPNPAWGSAPEDAPPSFGAP